MGPVSRKVYEELRHGPRTAAEIAVICGISPNNARSLLNKLKRSGSAKVAKIVQVEIHSRHYLWEAM